MKDLLNDFSDRIHKRLRKFGGSVPTKAILHELIRVSYFASLSTEEGRFVRASLTYADPEKPDLDPPFTRRAHYPHITSLGKHQSLTVKSIVKLGRAVDNWSGSIAVWGTISKDLVTWGIVDQMVSTNVRMHRERTSGFRYLGVLTIAIDGVANISVYHHNFFLGGLRADNLVNHQSDAFHALVVADRIAPSLAPVASCIAKALDSPRKTPAILRNYIDSWSDTLARLCIGLRRIGTGGSLLITPAPVFSAIQVTTPFSYDRLGDSLALSVLDRQYQFKLGREYRALAPSKNLPWVFSARLNLAETDTEDREIELSGAVKLVTSLASVDGLVLLTPTLSVLGFGAKIGPGPAEEIVYDGPGFVRSGTRARKVDLSGFGTRHTSMLRYCCADPESVGIVVSQDGSVRMIMSIDRCLTLWDNVKLIGYSNYSDQAARQELQRRVRRAREKRSVKLGYSPMPKTVASLLELGEKAKLITST